jgi:hypothetical protein
LGWVCGCFFHHTLVQLPFPSLCLRCRKLRSDDPRSRYVRACPPYPSIHPSIHRSIHPIRQCTSLPGRRRRGPSRSPSAAGSSSRTPPCRSVGRPPLPRGTSPVARCACIYIYIYYMYIYVCVTNVCVYVCVFSTRRQTRYRHHSSLINHTHRRVARGFVHPTRSVQREEKGREGRLSLRL